MDSLFARTTAHALDCTAWLLQNEGAAGLQRWLAEEEERKKPEFLKQRPKYYYYYEWMKERICAQHPALPEPVMDKLLTMPAGDLDLILQHQKSTTWKASFAPALSQVTIHSQTMCIA